MSLFLILIIVVIAVSIFAFFVESGEKEKKEKANAQLIPIEIGKIEKYIPDGHVSRELIDLIIEAKEKGENHIMYPKGKYDELVSKSLKSYFEKKDGPSHNLVKCPKCKSTQITAAQKGYSATKGLAGAFLTGGVGLLAGFHGSKDLLVYCMKCGHKWKAGN